MDSETKNPVKAELSEVESLEQALTQSKADYEALKANCHALTTVAASLVLKMGGYVEIERDEVERAYGCELVQGMTEANVFFVRVDEPE